MKDMYPVGVLGSPPPHERRTRRAFRMYPVSQLCFHVFLKHREIGFPGNLVGRGDACLTGCRRRDEDSRSCVTSHFIEGGRGLRGSLRSPPHRIPNHACGGPGPLGTNGRPPRLSTAARRGTPMFWRQTIPRPCRFAWRKAAHATWRSRPVMAGRSALLHFPFHTGGYGVHADEQLSQDRKSVV